jgi:hypothetical protein
MRSGTRPTPTLPAPQATLARGASCVEPRSEHQASRLYLQARTFGFSRVQRRSRVRQRTGSTVQSEHGTARNAICPGHSPCAAGNAIGSAHRARRPPAGAHPPPGSDAAPRQAEGQQRECRGLEGGREPRRRDERLQAGLGVVVRADDLARVVDPVRVRGQRAGHAERGVDAVGLRGAKRRWWRRGRH